MRALACVLAVAAFAGCGHNYIKVDDVALGRVVVYRSGVAYYERRATVEGRTLTVSVPRDKVDDFLKSLTVTDARTGKALPATFPRQQSDRGAFLEMSLELPVSASGKTDVVLTYVTEAPAWKPSYRVVVGKDGKVMLEGWAIVDNTSGEDWREVIVGVGSSSALSFQYDLWSVRTVQRETLQSEERFAVAPPMGVSPYAEVTSQTGMVLADLYDTEIRQNPNAPVEDVRVAQPTATTGVIRGMLSDQATGEAAIGVTVVASSPSLAASQSAITDEAGLFQIPSLPPGTYTLDFYYGDSKATRAGVAVEAGKGVAVQAKLDTSAIAGEVIEISGGAPEIDTTTTSRGVRLDVEYTTPIPVGRTFEGALGVAAGVASDSVGTSFSGSTSLESNYITDGLSSVDGSHYDDDEPPPPPNYKQMGDAKLREVAQQAASSRHVIVIEGYASSGEADAERASLARANAVRDQLIDAGVAAAQLQVVARGNVTGAGGVKLVDGGPVARAEVARPAGTSAASSAASVPADPVGESHFQSKAPMTVGAGTSVMVSMVRDATDGEVVYLYDADSARGNERFAFRAVRLRNPTDSTLDPGPVTVYGDGRFIGEGLTEPIPPHATVVVPFALDRQVVVERRADTDNQIAGLLTLQRGILRAAVQHVRRTHVTLTNRLGKEARVYLRHTPQEGFAITRAPEEAEKVGAAHLFAVTVPAGETRTVEIEEATPIERTLDLGQPEGIAMVQAWLEGSGKEQAFAAQMQALLAIHAEIADTEAKIDNLRQRLVDYRTRMDELHAQIVTLQAVKTGGALMKHLKTKMAEVSEQVQQTTIKVVDQEEALMLARIRFQDGLAELTLESTGGAGTAATAAR